MKYKLGELAEIIDGDRGKNYPQQHEFSDEGYCLFLNTGNVTPSGFSFTSNQYISQEKCDLLRKGKLQRGDIVYTTRGTVGNAAFYSSQIPYKHIRINSGMVILRSNEAIVCKEFLYQILKSDYYRPYFRQYCTGSAQPQLPIKNFSKIELEIPDLCIQHRIASILSAYDDLIENNQKQIKLLEEAAQRLYKEWFVDLRFPGHESVPVIDGVPEGWKKGVLGDIDYRLESGSRPKGGIDASLKDGIPSIGAENVIGLGRYNFSSEKLIPHDFFQKMKRGKLHDKDILIYKDGAYIGRTTLFQDGFPHKEAAVNEHVFLLHASDEQLQYYLFYTLYQQEYFQKMQKLNKNAAQPGINSKALMLLPLLFPEKKIVEKFDTAVFPLMKKIFNLSKQNSALQEARDRLLPKLMSGEIEV